MDKIPTMFNEPMVHGDAQRDLNAFMELVAAAAYKLKEKHGITLACICIDEVPGRSQFIATPAMATE